MRCVLKRSLAGVPALLLLSLALTGCGSKSSDDTADAAACSYPTDGTSASVTPPEATPTASGDVAATIHTNKGDIAVTLDAASAPCTVNSFLSLAQQKYFDKTPCHRLTTSGIYVLQCGDPTGSGSGGPGYSFADELTSANGFQEDKAAEQQYAAAGQAQKVVVYPAGTVAMANSGANTNGSQFFLVYAAGSLPPAYTAFGTISTSGIKVLTGIAKKGSTPPGDGAPNAKPTIMSVTVG